MKKKLQEKENQKENQKKIFRVCVKCNSELSKSDKIIIDWTSGIYRYRCPVCGYTF